MTKSESLWVEGKSARGRGVLGLLVLAAAITLMGCKGGSKTSTNSDAARPAETGVEKFKPAPGTGNVQGKVLFNSKPAENIDVKLCEKFSRYLSGCGGQTYTARTDKEGEYVITNVPPNTYEALTARVFETDSYIFATTGPKFTALSVKVNELPVAPSVTQQWQPVDLATSVPPLAIAPRFLFLSDHAGVEAHVRWRQLDAPAEHTATQEH